MALNASHWNTTTLVIADAPKRTADHRDNPDHEYDFAARPLKNANFLRRTTKARNAHARTLHVHPRSIVRLPSMGSCARRHAMPGTSKVRNPAMRGSQSDQLA